MIQEDEIGNTSYTVSFGNVSLFIQQDTIAKVILTGKGRDLPVGLLDKDLHDLQAAGTVTVMDFP